MSNMKKVLINEVDFEELLTKIGELIDAKLAKNNFMKSENQVSYFTRFEVAAMLKISLSTLGDWTKLGWLTSYKMGNRVYYKLNEVETAMEKLSSNKHKRYIN